MSAQQHTALVDGQPGAAATFEGPLGQLDQVISDLELNLGDYVVTGGLAGTSANLTTSVPAIRGFVGNSFLNAGSQNLTVAASKDTYVDIDVSGVLHQVAVANGAAEPAVTASCIRLFKAVSSGTAITSVTDRRRLAPWASVVAGAALRVRPTPTDAGGTQGFQVLGPLDPGAMAAEYIHGIFSLGTLTFDATALGGTLTNERWVWIQPPTINATGALNVTNPTTLYIAGPPVAGTNVTFPGQLNGGRAAYALNIASGGALISGVAGGQGYDNNALVTANGFVVLNAMGGPAGFPMAIAFNYSGDIAQSGPFGIGADITGGLHIGNATNQKSGIGDNFTSMGFVRIEGPQFFSNTVGTWTITDAATLALASAPSVSNTGAGTAVITNAWTLRILGGKSQFGGAVEIHSPASNAFTVDAAIGQGFILQVDASTASAATGIKIKSAASGGGIAISALGGAAEAMLLDAKGAGKLQIGSVSTGNIEVGAGGGAFSAAHQVYPGAEAGGIQVSGGFLHATGVPSNTNGNNNDWAISDNGHIYFKSAGTWAQKV